ncbi:hypothetical protein [Streptomyces sp. bgisy153]|uniref:hypothetical protein n=1 Tax=Streptomyces sp. bgisy153 TaxID=3413793 RepID=UPI003D74BD25
MERERLWAALTPTAIRWILSDETRFRAGPATVTDGFLLTSDGAQHRWERALFARHFGERLGMAAHRLERAPASAPAVAACREAWRVVFGSGADDRSLEALVGRVRQGRTDGDPVIEDLLSREGPARRLFQDLAANRARPTARRQTVFLVVALTVALLQTLPGAALLAGRRAALRAPETAMFTLGEVDSVLAEDTPLLGLFRFASAAEAPDGAPRTAEETPVQLCWLAANQRRGRDERPLTFGVGAHRCPARNMSLRMIRQTLPADGSLGPLAGVRIDGLTLPHIRMPVL